MRANAKPTKGWVIDRRTVREIVGALERAHGQRRWHRHNSGVAGLVQTILSQNTSDVNSRRAFRLLRTRFPSWEQVLTAPTSEIERAIRVGGLSRVKSPRIKRVLQAVKSVRGRLSLRFLARMPLEEARAFLQDLDGVGPKTAACVLMFCYNRPALPVDTHVHRVARRLGLIPESCPAERAHVLLERACPPGLVYPFHVLMVEHGRRTCRALKPTCGDCALRRRCPSAGAAGVHAPAPE
jgi:endonuclease-3